jgi:hypothetical protein
MTIQKKLGDKLIDHGLWPDEAFMVIEAMKASGDSMRGRWEEDVTAYPETMIDVLWLTAKAEAVKWIEANKPGHFAKGLLA